MSCIRANAPKNTVTGRPIGLFAALLLVALVGGAQGQERRPKPLSVDDAIDTHDFEPSTAIRVSKGGRYVAYTLTNPARIGPHDLRHNFFLATGVSLEMQACEVWVVDTHTGEMRNVSGGKASSWSPSWSPDGRLLAFYSDRGGVAQLWIWDSKNNSLRRATSAVAHAISGLDPARWTPDGKRLVVKINPEGVPLAEAFPSAAADPAQARNDSGPTAVVYSSDTIVSRTGDTSTGDTRANDPRAIAAIYVSDLAIVDLETGSVRRLVRRQPITAYVVAPDGKYVAYSIFRGTGHADLQPRYDLAIVPVLGGASRLIAHDVPQVYGINMSWSPNGAFLAYQLSSYPKLFGNPPTAGDCFVVDPATGASVNVTPGPHPLFDGAFRRPVWSADGDRILLVAEHELWAASPSGKHLGKVASLPTRTLQLIVQTGEDGPAWTSADERMVTVTTFDDSSRMAGFAEIDIASGRVRQLIEERRYYSPYPAGVAAMGHSIYYVAEDAQHPTELWTATADFSRPHQLTHANRQFDSYEFGQARLVHWLNTDGRPLSGALLLPSIYEPGKSYPVIVDVYGGGTLSNDVYRFGMHVNTVGNRQLFATRGFAVLCPDAPLRVGSPAHDLASDVLPGVNRVIELGIADANRVGIMGASYGGYSVLAIIGQTTRFKAAVSIAGFSDIVTFYSLLTPNDLQVSIGAAENGQVRMGGTPWEYRDRYIENSPFFSLDRVHTPLLLIHGSLDAGVPPILGEQTYVALRRLGKEVTYAKYIGEDHTFFGIANIRDATNRVLNWFGSHLKAGLSEASPSPLEDHQP